VIALAMAAENADRQQPGARLIGWIE
jgi:hypothetical protein